MYTEEQRQKLILFLFERMMAVLEGMRIYVATPDGIPDNRYTIIRDEWGDINRVVARARSRITDDLLILPCDLPFVEREDMDQAGQPRPRLYMAEKSSLVLTIRMSTPLTLRQG